MTGNSTIPHRLVFLTVNSSFSHSSLALPLLHSACRELPNWEWLRYDMTIASDVMTAVRDIASLQCDLLATDLYLFNRHTAMDVLQRFHVIAPECRIAVGGPECLGEGAEELLRQHPYLDRIFRGEGEEIFRDYLENFDDPSGDPAVLVPPDGNAVYANWASSPYPAEDVFFVADKPFVQIETSRGCPMKCFYCTSGNTHIRYRSIEQVQAELQMLAGKGVKEVRILDRTFNLPQSRAVELLQLFRREFPAIKFHLELHPQFLDKPLRTELAQARPGQLHIEAGIQCLDPAVQNFSGRCSDTEKLLDGLKYLCEQQSFVTHADLLAGLPGQRWENIIADTAKLMQLNTAEIQLEVLKALPGTPLRSVADAHGIKYNPSAPYDVMQSNTMSMEQIQYARDLSRLLDITYNHHFLHSTVWLMNRDCPDMVRKLLEFFHAAGGSSTVLWDLKKRFLFLLDFCQTYQLADARRQLAWQWLLAGYPQQQGPDEYSCKEPAIPGNAEYISGNLEAAGARESRYWSFVISGKKYFLAYNRQYALNRPAAIWVLDKADTTKVQGD